MDDQVLTYPKGCVVGIAADHDRLEAVKERLGSLDVASDDIEVYCGEQGQDQLDPDTGGGVLGGAVRVVQKALGDEGGRMKKLNEAVESGAYVVQVPVPEGDDEAEEAAKQRIGQALIDGGATSVAYYGDWQIEEIQIGA